MINYIYWNNQILFKMVEMVRGTIHEKKFHISGYWYEDECVLNYIT